MNAVTAFRARPNGNDANVDDLTKRRVEHNEQVFKAVNEEIDERATTPGDVEYVCECADTACSSTIRLTHAEYAAVRAQPDHYLVLADHVFPQVEDVVERHDGWLVVRKR